MTTPQALVLSFLVRFLCVFANVVLFQFTKFNKLELPQGVTDPISVAFRPGLLSSEGPFTTVLDGRIMKWQGANDFVDFAYTSPLRTKKRCDGTSDPNLRPICGRPIDLSFHPLTGSLYITDAYRSLLVVGTKGGLATQLASGFNFTTGVDIDRSTGYVYF